MVIIRTAIESNEMSRCKQASFYMFQSILETNENEVMQAGSGAHSSGDGVTDLADVWSDFILIVDQLLDFEYWNKGSEDRVDRVVASLPSFWYTMLFKLIAAIKCVKSESMD